VNTYTAFVGFEPLASGRLNEVALAVKDLVDQDATASVLIFDERTGEQVDVDLQGTPDEVSRRLQPKVDPGVDGPIPPPSTVVSRGPGRPRLGVVAREVTLLPRHWEWLSEQPGGASVALRRLVEQARKANEGTDRRRRSQEAAYRFMVAMGGNLVGFEEAARALFAGNRERLQAEVRDWPPSLRSFLLRLAEDCLGEARTEQVPERAGQGPAARDRDAC
jgi:hypothetical protein